MPIDRKSGSHIKLKPYLAGLSGIARANNTTARVVQRVCRFRPPESVACKTDTQLRNRSEGDAQIPIYDVLS